MLLMEIFRRTKHFYLSALVHAKALAHKLPTAIFAVDSCARLIPNGNQANFSVAGPEIDPDLSTYDFC